MLRFLEVLLRYRKQILVTAAAMMLGALAFALLRPRTYTARVMLFISSSQSDMRSAFGGQLPPGLPSFALGVSNPNTKLVGVVLNSQSLADSVQRRAGRAQERRIRNEQDGSITIEILHRDPERAARIANAYPDLINALVLKVGLDNAVRKQDFLESQLVSARERLELSEQQMVQFQRGRDAPEPEEQGRRTIEAAAQLQQRIAEKEIEVSQLRRALTPDNPELRSAEAELTAWRAQLRRLTSGGGGQVFLPLSESAELKATATRILREYGKNEQIYLTLTANLAQTQIDAKNSLPVVSVIDPASPPTRPTGAGVVVTVLAAAVLGVILGVFGALLREYLQAARREPRNADFFAAWDRSVGSVARLTSRGRRRVELSPRG